MSAIGIANASAILMARIVDSAGESVRQVDIVAIQYSIYEVDQDWPGEMMVMNGHEAVSLDVAEVISDSLETDAGWTADRTGYNFRHEIDFNPCDLLLKADAKYQICYELTPRVGGKTIVRFQLRINEL